MSLPQTVRLRRKDGVVIQGCDTYIGRPQSRGGWKLPGSIWANPFKVGQDGTVDQVCAKYYWYMKGRHDLLARLPELYGQRLGCWCDVVEQNDRDLLQRLNHPECHGEVLTRLVYEQLSCTGP